MNHGLKNKCEKLLRYAKNDDLQEFTVELESLSNYLGKSPVDKDELEDIVFLLFKDTNEIKGSYCLSLFNLLNTQPLSRVNVLNYIHLIAQSSDLRLFDLTVDKINGYNQDSLKNCLLESATHLNKTDLAFEIIERYHINKNKAFNIALNYKNIEICEKFLYGMFNDSAKGLHDCIKKLIRIGSGPHKEFRNNALMVLEKLTNEFPGEKNTKLFFDIYEDRPWVDEESRADFLVLLIPENDINEVLIWAFHNDRHSYIEKLINKADIEKVIEVLGDYSSENELVHKKYNEIKSVYLNAKILDTVVEKPDNKKFKVI